MGSSLAILQSHLESDTLKQGVPYIDFSPLENAVAVLGKAADHAYELS